jgi:hypothetical protein
MKQTKIPDARAKLAASIPSTTEILRGSLLHRTIRHRSGCSTCAQGLGHPVWVLTVTYPGFRGRVRSTNDSNLCASCSSASIHGRSVSAGF